MYLLKPNTDTDNITEYQILIFARLPDINYSPNNIRLKRILKYSVSTLKFLLGKTRRPPSLYLKTNLLLERSLTIYEKGYLWIQI